MNPLHTQGDWVCIDGNIFSDGFTTKTPIARVYKRKSPHVTLANARLIAAAPELLDALRLVMNCAGDISSAPDSLLEMALDDGDDETRNQANAFLVARAAIAKATGTTS